MYSARLWSVVQIISGYIQCYSVMLFCMCVPLYDVTCCGATSKTTVINFQSTLALVCRNVPVRLRELWPVWRQGLHGNARGGGQYTSPVQSSPLYLSWESLWFWSFYFTTRCGFFSILCSYAHAAYRVCGNFFRASREHRVSTVDVVRQAFLGRQDNAA